MNKQIRTGVIGVGNMGQHHARIYASLPGSTLIGVADTDVARANAIASRYDVRPFHDYRRLLDEVDAVSVAAPTTMHHQIGMECLRRGVHVLMEKPLAASVAEAHALDDLAVPSGLVLQVGHVERFNPTFVELANVLRDHKVLAHYGRAVALVHVAAADPLRTGCHADLVGQPIVAHHGAHGVSSRVSTN